MISGAGSPDIDPGTGRHVVGSFQVVHAARRHDRSGHRSAAASLFVFALVGAGLFTPLPGRILHAMLFGP